MWAHPGKNCCLWAVNLRRGVSGISKPVWIGTCWTMKTAGIPVCSVWFVTLTIAIASMRRCMNGIINPLVLNGWWLMTTKFGIRLPAP
ncbi:hypothetical protein A8P48_17065 [Yersinia pestis]|nr:hypothetical protein A8P48_17065 [Yersinia pestis]